MDHENRGVWHCPDKFLFNPFYYLHLVGKKIVLQLTFDEYLYFTDQAYAFPWFFATKYWKNFSVLQDSIVLVYNLKMVS